MKNIFAYLSLFALIISGCSVPQNEPDAKDVIFVSILPQQYVVNQLANGVFDVEVMLPPGSNPHIYEPTPGQIRKLSKAKAYIRVGHIGFEKAWMEKISSANPTMVVFDQSIGVNFIRNENAHDHAHSDGHAHNHGVVDPHIWLSPVEMNVQAVNISQYLTELMPDSARFFQANLNRFKENVAAVDKKISSLLSNTKRKSFMIYHPALTYFARDYNLEQLTLEFEGKEPSGKYITELIELTKENNIKTVFIQREFPIERAEMLANELQANVQVLDPLEYDWAVNMLNMATKIQKALNE